MEEIRRTEEEENKLRNIKTKLRLFWGLAAAVAGMHDSPESRVEVSAALQNT